MCDVSRAVIFILNSDMLAVLLFAFSMFYFNVYFNNLIEFYFNVIY